MNSSMDEAMVYILHTLQVKNHFSFVSNFVDIQRKEKAERYMNEKDQLLSFGAGYLLKKYLPNKEIKYTESGKPYLESGPCFNLSHSGEYVVLAIHPSREVGIDIERINKNKIDGIQFVLNDDEKSISDIEMLFKIWSNKESLIKCTSTGLKDIKNVSGLPPEGMRIVLEETYYLKSMIYEGYSLSLALKGKEPFNMNTIEVEIIDE